MSNVIHLSALEDPEARRARKVSFILLVLREDWAALLEAAEAADMGRTMQLPEPAQLEDWKSVRQLVESML